ncbi:AbfB domain-containing protein [Actinomycetes bacterium KLBMP 9797]
MAIRLQSLNFLDLFIRHANFEAELMKLGSPGPVEDFAWNQVDRGRDNDGTVLVAFESVNLPGHFLRHRDFRLQLTRDDGSALFRKDSTFRRRNGLEGDPEQGWRSFEASNFRDHFIRHRDFHVYVEKGDKNPASFKRDATFKRVSI